ncbi:DUF1322 family protein (plasmid) [Borreliella americana]
MIKRNRDIDKAIENLNKTRKKYFQLVEEIKNNKYYFPIIMNICSYEMVKKLPYDELLEVNQIAELKLEKELFELVLSK